MIRTGHRLQVFARRESHAGASAIVAGLLLCAIPAFVVAGTEALPARNGGRSIPSKLKGADGSREFRNWTSASGSAMEARLVEVRGDVVSLEGKNGKRSMIKLSQLSRDDQDYIAALNGAPKTGQAARVASENKGRAGVYQVKTANPAYNYWVYVPASYSDDNPAGLHIFFHGQFNSNGADNFWVSKAMLDDFNLIGINMEYTDGDYGNDPAGKLAAAEQAVRQTMADYKVIRGRGIIASFSGGGIVHQLYFDKHGKGGLKKAGTGWTFCLNALYGSNYRGSAKGGSGLGWLVCLHENERNMGRPTVGESQCRLANEMIAESLEGKNAIDTAFLYVKGAGHGIVPVNTAWAHELFKRTDLAFAPFIYAPDYPQRELATAVNALGEFAYGRAEASLKQVLASPQTAGALKEKAESLSRKIDERIEKIVALGKTLSERDPILCDTYGNLILRQFAGHSRAPDVKAAFDPGMQAFARKGLMKIRKDFYSKAPGMIDLAGGKVGSSNKALLESTIESAGKDSQCGMMAQALLDCVE